MAKKIMRRSSAIEFANRLSEELIPHLPAATLIIIAGLLIYAPALHGIWIGDDSAGILTNAAVREPGGIWKIWFHPESLDYFPLTTTAHWALWQVFGDRVVPFHFVNIMLHVGSGLVLWRLLALLGVRHGWIGGLLWVVHPLAVESVAWISELKNTLSQFLLLLALVNYVRWSGTRSDAWRYIAALLLFVAAMLSKTSVVMLPFVLLLYGWWKSGRLRRPDVKAVVPFFATALVLALVTVWFQQNRGIGAEYVAAGGFAARTARAGLAIAFYFVQCVLPVNIMLIYPRWNTDPPSAVQFLPWLALAAVLGALWSKRASWGRHALLGFGFFLLNLVPVLGFVTMAYMWVTWTADHFAYLSLAGIVGLAAAGASAAWTYAPRFRPVLATLAVLVIGLFAWQTHDYAGAFRDNETLYSRAVEKNPEAWTAHRLLAQIAQQAGRKEEAQQHYAAAVHIQELALEANPNDPVAHYQLGLLLEQQGNTADAIPQFETALKLKPDYVGAHGNLGFIYFLTGHVPEAKKHFEEALRLGPNSAEIHYNLGYVLYSEGNYTEALPQFQEAVRLRPDYSEAHFSLAQTYQRLNRKADALREYEETLRERPDSAELRKLVDSLESEAASAK